uniref:HDC09512 n=1 Tax=Drosophila melanogaster TaxID=7227 RepID=Q6ILF0_DROME|nr:TPA_inf: HDC09512 [Drosophila melanogaster]
MRQLHPKPAGGADSRADIGRTAGSPIETLVWDPRADDDIRVFEWYRCYRCCCSGVGCLYPNLYLYSNLHLYLYSNPNLYLNLASISPPQSRSLVFFLVGRQLAVK